MDANSAGFKVGAVIGAALVGLLCGLIPLTLGRKRDRVALGWAGFGLCIPAGLLLGLIGGLPMAGLMSLIIVIVGPPKKKKKSSRISSGPLPRTAAAEPYEI